MRMRGREGEKEGEVEGMRRRREVCVLTCCSTFVHSSHAYNTHQNTILISHQISLEFVHRLSPLPSPPLPPWPSFDVRRSTALQHLEVMLNLV